MRTLSKYSIWQIEMAVTASLLRLDLLCDKQIFEYTHYLLDNEHYDDTMLSIIDDDRLYPNNKQELFRSAISSLGFPSVTVEQASWIYTSSIIHVCSEQPENYYIFEDSELDIYNKFYEFLDEDSNLQKVDEFKGLIYQLDDAYDNVKMGEIYKGYNDRLTLLPLKKEFFQLCQQWIKYNQSKLESVFAAIYTEIRL